MSRGDCAALLLRAQSLLCVLLCLDEACAQSMSSVTLQSKLSKQAEEMQ